jgi:hypothetical protein
MRKNLTTAARKGGNAKKEQKMKVFNQCLTGMFPADEFATDMLAACWPEWLPANIFSEMTESLRGFNRDMALLIADDLIDCWSGLGLHVTGIEHVDDLLGHFYSRILMCAFYKGVSLKLDF